METCLHNIGTIGDELLTYAVICAFVGDKLVLVRNRKRTTWEIPGGKREANETIDATACRELREETSAVKFTVEPICDYSVRVNEIISYGRLYGATIEQMEQELCFEVGEVKLVDTLPKELTYPEIQPMLYEAVIIRKRAKKNE
jgi:ADP-ribose pyrophosphatase